MSVVWMYDMKYKEQ